MSRLLRPVGRYVTSFVAVAGVSLLATGFVVQAKDDEGPSMTVQAADIPQRVQIIGRLGRPLGEMMDMRGKWERPDRRVKDYQLLFKVLAVNGKHLDKPVAFQKMFVETLENGPKPSAGAVWEIRGIETGGFRGEPAAFHRARAGLDEDGESPVQDPWGHTFVTELELAKCKEVTPVGKRP